MSVAWDFNRTKPINAYGPPGTEALVKAAMQYFTMSSELRIGDGGAPFQSLRCFFGHDIGSGVIYQDDNIKVMAVENTHFKLHQAGPAVGKYKSYSYRFDTPDRVVVFTGDTGPYHCFNPEGDGIVILVSLHRRAFLRICVELHFCPAIGTLHTLGFSG